MSENNVKGLMDVTMEKLKATADANTVIGTPITVGKITLIPVSKITFGIAAGGSDFSNSQSQPSFGGGSGAGVCVTPVAFLAVEGENVRVLPISAETTAFERAVASAPEIIDKLKNTFKDKSE